MTTPFPFVSGQVLTAEQLNDIQNLPISDKTASYTLVVGDVTKRTIMNSASATTITVDDSIFTVGDVIQVANKGAGTCTITAGAGVTINTSGSLALAQYGGGYLLALSASTFTFFNLGGALAVDFLMVGGGGGGGRYTSGASGGGGGGGGFVTGSGVLGKGTYPVKVGAAGAGSTQERIHGGNGTASGFLGAANGGGGGAGESAGTNGSSGGGGNNGKAAAIGISGEGNNGGTSSGATGAGGGGGSSAVGANGNGSGTGGAGGAGTSNDYNGTSQAYSGGGGGGAYHHQSSQ
jgi:hypothetical protein